MRMRWTTHQKKSVPQVDVLAVFLDGRSALSASVKDLGEAGSTKLLIERAAAEGFQGRTGQVWLYRTSGKPRTVILAGIEDPHHGSREGLVIAGAAVARVLTKLRCRQAGALLADIPKGLKAPEALRLAAEGVLHGAYRFERYLGTKESTPQFKDVEWAVVGKDAGPKAMREALSLAAIRTEAVCRVRDLVNTTAEDLNPSTLAAECVRSGRRHKFAVRVRRVPFLKSKGMQGILGVGRASAHPPCLVEMRYRPRRPSGRRIVLVGKGVTFDSGGLCIKNAHSMATMKDDMAGAGSVLALFEALAQQKAPFEVVGLLPIVENMVGPKGYRCGDVLRMASGKTVEVENTDAEGRLILADALWYAGQFRPTEIIDLATLTGGSRMALGPSIVAVLGSSDDLRERVLAAAREAGERFWPLPLEQDYLEDLRSPIADIRNSGPRHASTIRGALFLREFVPKDTPWLHLDIAGTAFQPRPHVLGPAGGTGVAIRSLLTYLGVTN